MEEPTDAAGVRASTLLSLGQNLAATRTAPRCGASQPKVAAVAEQVPARMEMGPIMDRRAGTLPVETVNEQHGKVICTLKIIIGKAPAGSAHVVRPAAAA